MSEDPFYTALAHAIADECGLADVAVLPEGAAVDVPGWDSLAHVRIMMNLEARLNRTVEMRDTYAAPTFAALRALFMG